MSIPCESIDNPSRNVDFKECPFCAEVFEIETGEQERAFVKHIEECRFENGRFGVGE